MPRRFTVLLIAAAATAPLAATAAGHADRGHRFCVSSIHARFDSDRQRDRAVVYSTRPTCETIRSRAWYLTVRLANGRVLRRPLGHDRPAFSESDFGCDAICAVSAAPDFNRDGRHEIAVSLQQGATQEQRGIYGLVGDELRRLPGRPGGDRFTFSYGGGGLYGAFVVCRTHAHIRHVVAVGWGRLDNAHSSVRESVYTYNCLRFRFIRNKTRLVTGRVVPPRVKGRQC
jgi:hypothetical protein